MLMGYSMNSRVTQRDIAREAGVSHVTVSLALRGDPGIPARTQKRIKKIADLLGYAPDPMLTALSFYRKQQRPAAYQANIAWLRNHPRSDTDTWGDFLRYYEGAKTRATELGYMLDEIEYHDYKQLRRVLAARNITGLILSPSHIAGASFHFDLSRYSAIRLGYSYGHPLLNTVANSQFRTALTAMQKAAALGYRRIGTILTEEVDERTSWHFLGGFLAGQHLLPKKDWIPPFYASPRMELAPAVHDWIVKEKIDCLVAAGYGALYRELVRRGVDFPRSIGYIDTQLAANDEYLSGIHQNSREIGSAAVDLLVSMMHRNDTGIPAIPSHLLIEGSWRDGKTVSKQHHRAFAHAR
jgi:DNA-binding LacI/PurR family transcriptional regulator